MFGREPEETKYFVSRKSKLLGPFPLSELKAQLRAGTVLPTDTAWTQGMLKWLPVPQVAGGAVLTMPSTVVLPAPRPQRTPPAPARKTEWRAPTAKDEPRPATPKERWREQRRKARRQARAAAEPGAAAAAAYASFRQRVIAYALDALVIYVLVAILSAELIPQIESGFGQRLDIREQALYGPLAVLTGWLYYALLESSRLQATFGKRWLGIHVADMQGRRIEFRRASLRYWGQYLSGALGGIGFLIAAFTPRRQALHDLLAGCVILRGRPRAAAVALA